MTFTFAVTTARHKFRTNGNGIAITSPRAKKIILRFLWNNFSFSLHTSIQTIDRSCTIVFASTRFERFFTLIEKTCVLAESFQSPLLLIAHRVVTSQPPRVVEGVCCARHTFVIQPFATLVAQFVCAHFDD